MSDEVTRLMILWQEQYDFGNEQSVQQLLATHADLCLFFERNPRQLAAARERIDKQKGYIQFMNDSSTPVWRPGDVPVSGYTLVKRRGAGGSGEVWEATGPGGLFVALKRVSLKSELGKNERDRLEDVRGIPNHVRILQLHGWWESEGGLVIASSLADRTLKDKLDVSPNGLPLDDLKVLMTEAAEGLDYLNLDQKIQHRDVKPANLFLIGEHLVVGDLGLIKPLDRSRGSHSGAGTPGYMAPEANQGLISTTSDQYSLAMTYIALRTGSLNLPPSLDNPVLGNTETKTLRKALANNPTERFNTCGEFAESLEAPADRTLPKKLSFRANLEQYEDWSELDLLVEIDRLGNATVDLRLSSPAGNEQRSRRFFIENIEPRVKPLLQHHGDVLRPLDPVDRAAFLVETLSTTFTPELAAAISAYLLNTVDDWASYQ